MRYSRFFLPALLLAASTLAAHADTLTYTESAIVSGSIGKLDFTNTLITLTATGDSSAVVETAPGVFVNILPTELTIAGIGGGMFTDTIQFVSNNTTDMAGVGDNSNNLGILFTESSVFGSYNLQSALAATTGPSTINSGSAFNTDIGLFTITSSGDATFQVTDTTVPEPSTFVLLGSGLLGLASITRRKFLSQS